MAWHFPGSRNPRRFCPLLTLVCAFSAADRKVLHGSGNRRIAQRWQVHPLNALTNAGALAANYPFATIEPNVGVVPVPDDRLERSANTSPRTRSFPPCCGWWTLRALCAGHSKGEGWATSSSATSAKSMRYCTWFVALKAATSLTSRAASIPSATSTLSIRELIYADLESAEKNIDKLRKLAKRRRQGSHRHRAAGWNRSLASCNGGARAGHGLEGRGLAAQAAGADDGEESALRRERG